MPAWPDAVVDDLRRDRVVQVDRHAPVERHGHVGQHGADGRRQQQTHEWFVVGQHVPQQQPPQDQRPRQQRAAGQLIAERIGDLQAAFSLLARPHKGPPQSARTTRSLFHRRCSQLLNRLPHLMHIRRVGDRATEADRNWIGPPLGPLPEELATLKTNDAPPHQPKSSLPRSVVSG